MRLFVYGSLKRGFFNHDRFGFYKVAEFRGTAIARDVSLVRLDNLPYPHAFVNEGGTVEGEVYDLDDANVVASIDEMERGAGYIPKLVQIDEEGDEAVMYVADDWVYRQGIKYALDNGLAKPFSVWKEVA